MKTISAAVLMNDEKLSEILAGRLAERESGIIAYPLSLQGVDKIISDNETSLPWDVVITDIDSAGERFDSIIEVSEADIDLAEISAAVISRAVRKRKEIFKGQSGSDVTLLGFRSDAGGSGVTAVSMTAARILNSIPGKKVLLVDMTENEGSRLYCRNLKGSLGNRRELAFCLKKSYPAVIREFTETDEGVHILYCGGRGDWADIFNEKLEFFLKEKCRDEGFDYAVIDAGYNSISWCDHRFCVIRDNNLQIKNKMKVIDEGESIQEFVNLTDDKSFERSENGIKIFMNGLFADKVKGIVKKIIQQGEDDNE